MSRRRVQQNRHKAPPPRKPATLRQKLFLIAFGILLAVLVITVLETALALSGVEAPDRYEDPFVGFEPGLTLFEKRSDEEGAPFYATRQHKLRLFNPQRFPDPKPAGSYRIFVLGGSTAYGRPYDYRTSFSRWMGILLQAMDPSRGYEVVNAGGVSYASYRIVTLMKELVEYQPDLFVVYTGHNEFLEERTYGDIIHESAAVRAIRKRVHGLRTFGVLRQGLARIRGHSQLAESQLDSEVRAKLDVASGLDLFTRDDRLRQAIVEHFRFNIQQMIDIARHRGVDILFINPASNIKDFSPFKSEHPQALDPQAIDRFEVLYREGIRLLEERSYEEALARLEEAAALSPEHADVHYRIGRCHLARGDLDQAAQHLTLAKELDICPLRALEAMNRAVTEVTTRNRAPLVDLLGMLQQDSLRRYGHAILGDDYFLDHVHPRIEVHQRLAERIIDTLSRARLIRNDRPLTAEARQALYAEVLKGLEPSFYGQRDLNLGKVLGWAGKVEEATAALQRAAVALPGDPMVHYNLGIVYQRQGKYDLAVEHYRQVPPRLPRFHEAHVNLGKCYQRLGDYQAAAESFLEALALKPDDGQIHYNLAQCYRQLGRYQEELAELEAAWVADATIPEISRLLASVYEREGRLEEALGVYRRDLEQNPDDAGTHNDVARVYRLLGRTQEALIACTRALELDPELAEAHGNLVLIHQDRGDLALAEQALLKVVELQAEDFRAYFELGRFYDQQQRWDEAIGAYRTAVGLNPRYAPGFSFLGAALGQEGRFDEAIRAFERSIELEPGAGGAHYHLASLYYSQGELEPAARHFQKASELGIQVPPQILAELQAFQSPRGKVRD